MMRPRPPLPRTVLAALLLVALVACSGPSRTPLVPTVATRGNPTPPAAVASPPPDPVVPIAVGTAPSPAPGVVSSRAPVAAAPVTGLPDDLAVDIDALLDAYDGRGLSHAGIIVKDAATGEAIRRNPDDLFPAASLYKPFLLWAVQDAIGAGTLRADTSLTLSPATDDSAEDGYRLGDYGDTITVAQARELMIGASNNTAAWLLVEAIGGWERIEGPLRDYGFHATGTAPDLETTPREVTRFFEGIVNETLDPDLDATDYALMRGLFAGRGAGAYLSAGLPERATFAHKMGNLAGVLHDAGVLTLADGRVVSLTVMTEGDYQAGQAFMHELAALVVTALGD